uniref:Uncharacterized protein n=1 Tax=Rousettus aegyptiacus TaxID=9407 RepID=A0A7J8DHW7_ROUAE|nr:hypothetical protein HJG63_008536 [Rousettus aegyptiacus]
MEILRDMVMDTQLRGDRDGVQTQAVRLQSQCYVASRGAGLKHHRKGLTGESCSDPTQLASALGHGWKWEEATSLLDEKAKRPAATIQDAFVVLDQHLVALHLPSDL